MFTNGTTLVFGLLFALTFSVAALAQGSGGDVQLGVDCTHQGHLDCQKRGGEPPTCLAAGGNPEVCQIVANPTPPWTSCYCDVASADPNACSCWKR